MLNKFNKLVSLLIEIDYKSSKIFFSKSEFLLKSAISRIDRRSKGYSMSKSTF